MPANKQQAKQTLNQMRQIINQLEQAETSNVRMAQQLAKDEQTNQQILSNAHSPNYQATAAREAQATNQLNRFASNEQDAAQKLKQLNQLLNTLEDQLS
ncbi:MAG: hypothetical protein ACOX2S_07285 [bacterium]